MLNSSCSDLFSILQDLFLTLTWCWLDIALMLTWFRPDPFLAFLFYYFCLFLFKSMMLSLSFGWQEKEWVKVKLAWLFSGIPKCCKALVNSFDTVKPIWKADVKKKKKTLVTQAISVYNLSFGWVVEETGELHWMRRVCCVVIPVIIFWCFLNAIH